MIIIIIIIIIIIERSFVMYKEWERRKPNKHRKFYKTNACKCYLTKGTFSKDYPSLKDPKQVIVAVYCNECGQPVKCFTKPK